MRCFALIAMSVAIVVALLPDAQASRHVRSERFLATAYCLRGTTATGTRVARGTVAVDPEVIPLHSRLRVAGYGYGRALDTGSAVIGHHVDLWMASCHDAIQWGARHVAVTVLR